jgi:2-polyprenyl-3-methyl-5-hydroxy-6-metoxy-1,4-benzoquinol methylase
MTHTRSHEHSGHPADADVAAMFAQPLWDERYGSTSAVWSGNPNRRLTEQAADLAPGHALDVGCGEGADAIWLAQRGWAVTAVDVSHVALERAARIAAEHAPDAAGRIAWQQADLQVWAPDPASFDLVSAHFMYLPQPAQRLMHERLAAAVRPGGRLLVVGHNPTDHGKRPTDPRLAHLMYTAEDVAAVLNLDEWDVEVCEAQSRTQVMPDGQPMEVDDAVLRARRH